MIHPLRENILEDQLRLLIILPYALTVIIKIDHLFLFNFIFNIK